MRTGNRRSALKVKDGRVQKKNNQSFTGNYFDAEMPWLVIDRRRPGAGYKHLLTGTDIRDFLQLVPQWEEFEKWLQAIVLEEKDEDCFGWHSPGVISICAWPRDIWQVIGTDGLKNEQPLLDLLGVPYTIDEKRDRVECRFTEDTARAHQLLGTLLHEIGHHIDRVTTRSKVKACRGEPFAREYAWNTALEIFDRYLRRFGL